MHHENNVLLPPFCDEHQLLIWCSLWTCGLFGQKHFERKLNKSTAFIRDVNVVPESAGDIELANGYTQGKASLLYGTIHTHW